jgi:hypothetical protein
MRDTTIAALEALGGGPDPRGPSIADHRITIERRIEAGGYAQTAAIVGAKPVLLLFDILVGITLGTLRHDQETWGEIRAGGPVERCGTYRCLAGWIAHLAYPGAVDVSSGDPLPMGRGMVMTPVFAQRLPDGRQFDIRDLAVAALLDLDPADLFREERPTEILWMFAASNSLADLWDYARAATGEAITVPDALRPQVDETRDDDAEVIL